MPMSKKRCYLAGGIFGLADRGQTWREEAIAMTPPGWLFINPNTVEIDQIEPRDLINIDLATILTCQAVLARVSHPSWGTAMEIFFACSHHVPVIAWDIPEPCSPWLLGHTACQWTSLKNAMGDLNNHV